MEDFDSCLFCWVLYHSHVAIYEERNEFWLLVVFFYCFFFGIRKPLLWVHYLLSAVIASVGERKGRDMPVGGKASVRLPAPPP